MAVTSVREIWDGRGGRSSEAATREYTRTFRVLTDDPTDGPLIVMIGSGLPQVGNAYTESSGAVDLGARCVSVDPQQDQDDPKAWLVTIRYSTAPAAATSGLGAGGKGARGGSGSDPSDDSQNPLLRPAEIGWSFNRYRKPIRKARLYATAGAVNPDFGTVVPVVNSAGDPFDPLPEVDDSRLILTVSRNEATFDPLFAIDYQDAVNSDLFLGAAPRQAKLNLSAKRQWDKVIGPYYAVQYDIEFRREGWLLSLLDAGRHDLNRVVLLDNYGQPYSNDVPLNGFGAKLTTDDYVFMDYVVYEERPFAALNLF